MTQGGDRLRRLLDLWDGTVVAPVALEQSVATLDENDPGSIVAGLTSAAQRDLSDVGVRLAALSVSTDTEARSLASRFGWTVNALTQWGLDQDRPWLRLEAGLASIAMWDESGAFWEVMRSRLANSRLLFRALKYVLEIRGPQALIPDDAPFWEREHFQALQDAERAQDWAEVGERAQAFHRLPPIDPGARQAAAALALLDWQSLVSLADATTGWLNGHLILASLSLVEALRLAVASKSAALRFAALERVARREVRRLSSDEETACRNLLIVLSRDRGGWPSWLALCNRYPVQHPHIQKAFGRALARGDADVFRDYVASIELTSIATNSSATGMRDSVTHCLATFRSYSNEARRRALWGKAFDRWRLWNFGVEQGERLSSPARSALDYGAVGWLVEAQPRRTPAELEAGFESELAAWDALWHASLPAAVTGFFAMVSRHHLHVHAAGVSAADSDWSPGTAVRPPQAAADPYVLRRYRWDDA